MKPLNLIDIETPWGFRAFELHHGDITQLDVDVDILAVSAFKDNYEPVPGTIIEALLNNLDIDLRELAKAREFDLVDAFGCWTAQVVPKKKFGRIICAEIVGGNLEPHEVVENVFAVLSMLEVKDNKIETLALPILGAGQQQLSPTETIKNLLQCAQKYMNRSATIKKILFVELKESRAQELDKAMNDSLGRVKVVVPRGEWYEHTRRQIIKRIDAAAPLAGNNTLIFSDARRVFSSDQIRSFEMGIASRRLVEFVVGNLIGKSVGANLCGRIDDLGELHIAEWVRSYMHTLRVFGNESAHEKHKDKRRPAIISEGDMAVCLLCLDLILQFWIAHKKDAGA